MYNIEINFLNDRPEYRPESVRAKPSRQRRDRSGNGAVIAGAGVALAFLALVGGFWVYLVQLEIPRLQAERDELDEELGKLSATRGSLTTDSRGSPTNPDTNRCSGRGF